jgi:5'-nucleotidase/UDP-sugar diphosphatase
MTQLVRASALGIVALALAVPGPAVAKSSKKPKHTVTVKTVEQFPKTSRDLKRKCGKSKSAKRIRKRTTTRSTNRVRTVTTYCSGDKRSRIWIRQITKIVTVPAPAPPAPPGPPAPPPPARKGFRLTLLHNNDGESKYVVGDSVANYGGITRFKTVLDAARDAAEAESVPGHLGKGAVTVSSGDNFLAGLNLRASFQRFDAGLGPFYDSEAIAGLGYDAVTIGNHEYDFGPARLAQFVAFERSGVPFLTANTDFSAEPLLQALRDNGRIADSTVVERDGQEIGIIGISPPETPTISSSRNVRFLDDVAGIVNAEAARLTRDGVNKIILSSHLQSGAVDRALVPQLRNVDIVISGGADDLLANDGDLLVPGQGDPAGPYPTVVRDSTNTAVPIVTTQGEYRYLGRLTVNFDAAGRIVSTDAAKSGPIRITADPAQPDYVAEDAGLKASVADPLVAYKAGLAANVIGTTDVLLDGTNPNPIRVKESNLGNLVADAFLAGVNRTAVADGRPVADVAFSNGGGIRTSIPVGQITEKSTFDVLPFDNVLVTVPDVTPQKFKDLMEWGVAARTANELQGDGRFPQISGFKIEWDLDGTPQEQTTAGATQTITTPGTRIQTITLDDGTKIVENGAVVPGAPNVNLATTNFTANNGDRYPFNGLTYSAAGVPYQQSLYDFIVQDLGGSVTAADYPAGGEGRIVQLP